MAWMRLSSHVERTSAPHSTTSSSVGGLPLQVDDAMSTRIRRPLLSTLSTYATTLSPMALHQTRRLRDGQVIVTLRLSGLNSGAPRQPGGGFLGALLTAQPLEDGQHVGDVRVVPPRVHQRADGGAVNGVLRVQEEVLEGLPCVQDLRVELHPGELPVDVLVRRHEWHHPSWSVTGIPVSTWVLPRWTRGET